MKKSGFFRGVLDGIRSTVGQPSSSSSGAKALLETETEETLRPSHFKISTIVQHGFPYQPTSIAFDPIQRLIAIGTKNGSLRILGRPGVDITLRHVTEFAVLQIIFIINEGQLITICADDGLHLWNLRNKSPEIVHSLKFQKERISYCHLSFQSKWLYIGTERGNVYVVNIDTFSLSGYVINWNKTIELMRKTHPGTIIHISDCPIDSNKLLIGYESGCVVLWDLRNKSPEFRYSYPEGILSISWHSEGRQFICSHPDGSLSTWNIKAGSKPQSSIYPHAKIGDPKVETFFRIPKVEWRTSRAGDAFIMFSGGLLNSNDNAASVNSKQVLTVIHGKSTTVLEMEHDIIDFITLCESPYEADYNDPYAIVVLLENDLVVVNLQQNGYPCFQNPYSMDLHESPVTYCYYLANCPPDLVHTFYSVGQKFNKRTGTTEREWPINGGEWGSSTVSYPEIIITGHADGSLKFWDASAVNLQILYKLKTAKLFEKPRLLSSTSQQSTSNNSSNSQNNSNKETETGNNIKLTETEDHFAIEYLTFSAENRVLCIAGASSQVIVFRFNKQEAQSEITVIEVPMNYDELDPQADSEILSGASSLLYQADSSHTDHTAHYPLRVRTGHHKRLSGFQAELICISPWIDRRTPAYRITSMCYNNHARLLAYGTENSLVIIDLVQKSIVLNVSTASLYGTCDPYQRTRPKRCTSTGPHLKDSELAGGNDTDRCRSPVPDSANDVCMSPIARSSQSASPLSGGHHYHHPLHQYSSMGPASAASSAHMSAGGSISPSAAQLQSSASVLGSSSAAGPGNTGALGPRAKTIAQSVANTELKRSRSQGTRNKLQMMHTIHQSMMIMPATIATDHHDPERLINSSSINHIGLHHHHHHGISLGTDKIDSFTRSRSSSMSSLENVGTESIQYLIFANTFVLKSDTGSSTTLWAGTSCGTVLIISLTMPDSMDNRELCLQTVLATPSPTIFRLKGSILNISFLDLNGCSLPLDADSWKENKRNETCSTPPVSTESKRTGSLTIMRTGSGGVSSNRNAKTSPTISNCDVRDSHLVLITSEKQIRLIVMPQQICAQKAIISETSFGVRADLVYIKNQDAHCLAVYLGTGNIIVYSLPSLRVLLDNDFLPLTDVRIARTMLFSVNGHGMYLSSPSELTKFTILASFSDNLPDMLGSIYTCPKELPEPPKQSFLKGFFGGTPTPLDREELFGESTSGKASKTVARLIPGSMEHSKAQTSAIGGEFSKLREGFAERGERLNRLEDSTVRMQSEAEAFSGMAHAVMLKYRDKKWYQF